MNMRLRRISSIFYNITISPLAIKSDVAKEASLKILFSDLGKKVYSPIAHFVAAPGKHRQWHGNGYINTYLTNVHIALKFTCSSPRLRKDCSAVTIFVVVDYFNGVIKRLSLENDQNWSKDFFPASK